MNTQPSNVKEKRLSKTKNGFPRRRIRFGFLMALAGFLIFLLGIRPQLFQLDRSPVIGFVQISVMLVGLAAISIGGYICMRGLWKDKPLSLAAEIGMRFISTGYVIAFFSAFADIFGFGSHPFPEVAPYFGELQALGVTLAEIIIGLGLFLMIPYHNLPRIQLLVKSHINSQ